ncbi:O-antigen/teichoic acid export membrane protein [Parabacteroides sp. PF5-5]|uniref:lipopolysaccharide biosynthesis protein n=1 Tax=unclassified Parabacteroides TaxID=2649774 RepID=UPI002474DF24|nr:MULTISPECIES: oligosaccharide flippase family protein [unclassified Parabacteroides]MDH6303532.1 O-antigen/teichoic acid export membrane protein [Parabacteroides sp. PH5-39]MDH6314854.1 O-antigen/teichoic acid export membrane protein [Parabacteroides sp. PF5-13]MDH6318191.1 O-antigen/teichoic acid export membrane protein [Parabacteroides sp. PH5-13]MDH6321877.1 O-antigen/teichoic acid export membrane protein [Parabacteroides sp. PH5-8]MDH6326001.1 O-antigen/teichoic acid export membrane pro
MAKEMKRLAKDTAVYGLSSIIGRFLNWLLVPMYTRVLSGPGEFGIYTNLYAWVALLLVLLTYGMETGFFRFINKKEETEPLRVYGTTLFSLGTTSLLFILLSFLLLTPSSRLLGYEDHPEYLAMMLGIVAVDAFCSIPFAYLRYQGRAYRFAGIKLLSIFLNIILNIFFLIVCPWLYKQAPQVIDWFYVPNYGVGYVFVANVATTLVTFLILLPDMLPGFRHKPDFPLLKQILYYSFPILILGIAGVFNQTADKIIFPFLFEDKEYANEQLGIYGACFKIAVVMVMFIQAFRYAYEPFIFARHKSGEDNTRAYSEAMKYFIIFALLIFLGVMFYIDILKLFVAPDYYPGLKVVPIVMLGELFFGIYFNLSLWYKLSDQTQWGAYFSLAGCVATVLIIILFAPVYGFMACAWASFVCNLCMMLLSYFVGQKKFPIPYDLRSAFIYFALATVLFIAGMLPSIENEILRLAYRTALLLLFIVFMIRRDLPLRELPYIGRFFN